MPLLWVASISLVRLLLALICCSTLAYWTSWLVNALVSIGLDGSWFFSCVMSRFRKSPKLLVSELSDVLAELVAPGTVAAAAAVVVMSVASYAVMSRPDRVQP